MKIFIAGARNIKALDDNVKGHISSICEKGHDILVGDCYGVDASIQMLCVKKNYKNVTIYASNGLARNNIGHWTVKSIPVNPSVRGFDFYRQKDLAMSHDADFGYMVWDGVSKGTLCNIISLISQNKLTEVHLAPVSKTLRIQTHDDLEKLIAACPQETQRTYMQMLPQPTQVSLF